MFDPRRAGTFAALGLAAYLIALLAAIPAGLFVPANGPLLEVDGTIWHGEAALDGGDRLRWRFAPLRSLVNLGFAVDWRVDGAATDLGGGAVLAAGGRVALDSISGRADGALLRAAAPGLPFTCELDLQFDLPTLRLGGADQRAAGEIRSDAGGCRPTADPAASPTAVPPLLLVAEPDARHGTAFSIVPLGQRRTRLVDGTLDRDGRLRVTIGRAGAAVLPFAAPNGGLSLETQL